MFVNVWIESPDTGNQLLVVNRNCMRQNILDYIERKCQLKERLKREGALLDLADEEGNLRHLPLYHPRQNATFLLTQKATYIPVVITRNDDGTLKPFEPVPTSLKTNQDFMAQLNAQFEVRTKPPAPTVTGRKGQSSSQAKSRKTERMSVLDEKDDFVGASKGTTPKKNGGKQGAKGKR
ncbi:hypothetical protein HOLleu_41320 [Holothuria leucospilota]|uniref:Uncharacterized protein n=1 Tax=Holothuria leucospilota TaxID=206669 RepID=A0A9Q1BBS2_HOLLE|nr:hypothetical protein HOLleu_41320 [Holothuria leucospilota]